MSTYKVLIAEDNLLFANTISKILSDLNIENTIAADGKEALSAYHQDYFDLILLDILMPEMNGFETSKEIRKTNKTTPIIALTSLPYTEIKQDLEEGGINDYLSKPSDLKHLKYLLYNYFNVAA
jgi:CheY-like chemotaxis protein